MTILLRRAALFSLASALIALPALSTEDPGTWSQFRGPTEGRSLISGELPDDEFGLRVRWSRELGSGYSNVWIEGDRVVTLFSTGEVDVVAAFARDGGEEIWRFELGETYQGHDGSDDGPIATPTVYDGTVYALGPFGLLVALDLEDGRELWRASLDESNATVPPYGFAASPVIAGDLLFVTTGGEGHAVTAFDRHTGEVRWARGDDSVHYQTPMMLELGGRPQLLATTDYYLQGLDPETGDILWQLRHTEDNEAEEAAHPTPVDNERFLVKYARGTRLYAWRDDAVEEIWQSRAFGNGLSLPVLVEEHLYGFTGSVLSCASAADGEIVWRTRAVSGFGLSLVDGRLAILSREGDLVLVEPSPEGYRELTRVAVLDSGNYAVPSFSDGLFLLRNLEEMAAVAVDTSLQRQTGRVDDGDRLRGELGQWIASVEARPEGERQAAVDQRFRDLAGTPLLEEGGLVHFVWLGDATDVGLTGDMTQEGAELGLYRLEGTDLFYRSLELDPKAQYSYNLTVDFGDPGLDPGNPYSVDNGFVVVSELRMPEWPASPHLEEPAEGEARGSLDHFLFRSLVLDNSREIQVWRPADYDQDRDRRYPVLVVNHGDNVLRGGLMQNTLDNLVGKTLEPLIAVFVPRVEPPEYGGERADDYLRFLVDELVPHVDRHYRTDGKSRAIMGPGSAGVEAVLAALKYPEIFSRAAALSFYDIEPARARIPELIAAESEKPELVYLVWSHNDYDLGESNAETSTKLLLGQLRDRGIEVVEQVSDYFPGWGGWRGQDDEILATLFPIRDAPTEEGD